MIRKPLALLLFISLTSNYVVSLQVEGIVGGLPARGNTFRYHLTLNVLLNDEDGNSVFECNGAVIHPKFALLIASCVITKSRVDHYGLFIRRWYKLGRGSLDLLNGRALLVEVEEIYVPAEYDPYSQEADLAVAESKYEINFSQHPSVAPVDLPDENTDDEDLESTLSSGFGYNQLWANGTGSSTSKLRYVRSKVMEVENCKQISLYPSDNKLCVNSITAHRGQHWGLCHYDLGAPLVDGNTILGLAHKIQDNCVDTVNPAMFTRIKPYVPFINSVIEGNPLEGTRRYRGPYTAQDMDIYTEDI